MLDISALRPQDFGGSKGACCGGKVRTFACTYARSVVKTCSCRGEVRPETSQPDLIVTQEVVLTNLATLLCANLVD